MTIQVPEDALRLRLAQQSTLTALSRERRFWSGLLALWMAALVIDVAHKGLRWALWFPALNLSVALFRRVRISRQQPRRPEAISDSEVKHAAEQLRRCPSCGEAVLTSEWRCPRCSSMRHQFTVGPGGIDVWMPLALLGAFLGCVLLGLALSR